MLSLLVRSIKSEAGWLGGGRLGTRHQSFLQLPCDFSVLPRLELAALRPYRLGKPSHYAVPDELLKGKTSLKTSHLQPVTQSSSLSRDGVTGFVDLARGVVMASEEILSTSHYVSIITLPRLDSKHSPIILSHSRYGAPEPD